MTNAPLFFVTQGEPAINQASKMRVDLSFSATAWVASKLTWSDFPNVPLAIALARKVDCRVLTIGKTHNGV